MSKPSRRWVRRQIRRWRAEFERKPPAPKTRPARIYDPAGEARRRDTDLLARD